MYSTTDELEAALASLAAAYPTTSTLHAVPHPTHDGRTAHVLRVGARTDGPDGIAILGGVHAREWVPPEMCVSLAADLLEAYATGTGLGYGGASFTAAEVHRVMQHPRPVRVRVRQPGRPGAQPDDRGAVAQEPSTERRLRRRRHQPELRLPLGPHRQVRGGLRRQHLVRPVRRHDVYRGPSAASEPETQNVVWLLDTFPVRWLVDVHSAVPVVLYSWGSDTDQTADTSQSFRNACTGQQSGAGSATGSASTSTAHDLSVGSTLATTDERPGARRARDGLARRAGDDAVPDLGRQRRLLVLPALRRPGPARGARLDDRVRVVVPAGLVGGRGGRARDVGRAPAARARRVRGHRRAVGDAR